MEQTEKQPENTVNELETNTIPEQEPVTEQEIPQSDTDEITKLSEKCADLADKNLRLMAEFDNYRKRTMREKADLIKNAGENIYKDMLPLIDDFERALAAMQTVPETESLREGIELIYNKFIGFLNHHGVKIIETVDAAFDVEYHEAITTIPASDESQKGKIIDCVSKGYMLNDKVIRFAKVVVGE